MIGRRILPKYTEVGESTQMIVHANKKRRCMQKIYEISREGTRVETLQCVNVHKRFDLHFKNIDS